MAMYDERGVPKTRPVPQQEHIDAFEKQAAYEHEIRVLMTARNITWSAAKAIVDAKPTTADLDAVETEKEVKAQTNGKEPKQWGKPATAKKQ